MKKIVHISKPIGGVGVYIELLSKYIDNNMFRNILLCNTSDNIVKIEDNKGNLLRVHHINLVRNINIYNDFICLLSIIKILKKIKPDIIHCHSAKAGFLGRIAGFFLNIDTFYTPHAYSYLSSKSKLGRFFLKKIEQAFKFFPSKTLACSKSEYNRTVFDLKFNPNKVYQWNNSIEKKIYFKPSNLDLPNKFICTIGRPSYQKHTDLLIKSFQKVQKEKNDIHLVILGVGHHSPDLKKIEKLINELKLEDSITLIPWLEREQILSMLKKSIMYLSTSRYEGLPYALIEALALSKSCVVTNVDGNKDLVDNGINGFCVKENTGDISEKILEILDDTALREKMEKSSLERYKMNFSINKNIFLLQDIYLKSN